MENYRLYIDESGHHKIQLASTIPERYLSLCGVVIRQDIYTQEVIPRVEAIRSLFYTDHDFKPALHLADIIAKKRNFAKLWDPLIEKKFNEMLLELYGEVDFQIICVVIDKTKHYNQYVTPEHPYHYCVMCMLERYFKFLLRHDSTGDVMAESRGKKEDPLLSKEYQRFYTNGTQYIEGHEVEARFTSRDIKIKRKEQLIQGLELADLLALPTKLDVLASYNQIPELTENFTKIVIDRLQTKYFNGPMGVKRNGKKFI